MIVSDVLIALGARKDKRLIISSLFLAILSFFYFFVTGSGLHLKIYTFLYRVTYEEIFVTHVASPNTDTFILLAATLVWVYVTIKARYVNYAILIFFSAFLISLLSNMTTIALAGAILTLPVVSCLIIFDALQSRRILSHNPTLSKYYITITAMSLASLGIISQLVFISTGLPTVTVDKYQYGIYQQLLSNFTTIVMAALVFCIPLKILFSQIFGKMKVHKALVMVNIENKLNSKRIAVYLSLCVILAIIVALVPHLPIVNPNNERLGVDTPRYLTWLTLMHNQSVSPIDFALKSAGDRPLTLLILYFITETTDAEPFQVVEYSTTILVALLVLVTFFLVRELTGNDKISIVASFLSSISFQTLIGIYSGFYANWFALLLGYLSLGILVRYLKLPSKFGLLVLGLLMTGMLFAHTYTWTIMIFVAFVFLFVLLVLNYYPRRHILILYLVLSSSIAVDVLKSSWIGSYTGLEADVSVGIARGLGISQFSDRLGTLVETVQIYYGGVYANIVILGLVLYWLISCRPREPANIFIMIFMSTALIPLFIGDYVLQSRILYEIPFQIPAAMSLYNIGKKNGIMIAIALLLITGYLSFHILANLGYAPPDPKKYFIIG